MFLLLCLSLGTVQAAIKPASLIGVWKHPASGDILVFTKANKGRVGLEYFRETTMSCLAQWQPGEDSSVINLDPSDLAEYSFSGGRLVDDDGFEKRSYVKLAKLPKRCR